MQHRGLPETASNGGIIDAFLWAAERNSLGLLELRISGGIKIEERSSEGRIALQLAVGCGHMFILERP